MQMSVRGIKTALARPDAAPSRAARSGNRGCSAPRL